MKPAPGSIENVSGMVEIEAGLFDLGYAERGSSPTVRDGLSDFAWDNEKPAHKVWLENFAIDRAPVSVGEYLEFINAGGYKDFRWWYSAGWEQVNTQHWRAPLYWEQHDGEWMIRDFAGLRRAIDKASEPVSHVSFLEASAYTKWAGKRLPTEAEWEKAATLSSSGNTKQNFPWGDAAPDDSRANL